MQLGVRIAFCAKSSSSTLQIKMFPLLKNVIRNHMSPATKRLFTAEAKQVKKIHAFVTGPPGTGVGKTTVVQKVCSQLQERHSNVELRGFRMEEVRESYVWAGTKHPGPKIGFDVVTVDGHRGALARVDIGGLQRFKFGKGTARKRKKNLFVGKYRVLLRSFEKIALPELQIPVPSPSQALYADAISLERKRQLYVIDEMGRMMLSSKSFVTSIRALLRQGPQPPPRSRKLMDPLVVLAAFPESGLTHKLINEIKSREDCLLFEVSKENRDSIVTKVSDFLSQSLNLSN